MLLLLRNMGWAGQVPSTCNELIRNAFAPGVNDTIIPAFVFDEITTGGGANAVIITVNVTAAANAYGAGLDPATHRMRYVSIPHPPCAVNVTTSCVDDYFLAVNQPSCEFPDRFDANTGPIRFGAYLFMASGPETPGCTGETFTVQYDGVTLTNIDLGLFKIDFIGLLNGNTTNAPVEDLSRYKASTCPFDDGLNLANVTSDSISCFSKVMECEDAFTVFDPPYALDASARCQDTTGPIERTVWRVQRRIDFRIDQSKLEHNATFGTLIDISVSANRTFPDALLYPDSRRQYEILTISPDVLQIGWLEATRPRLVGQFSGSPGYNRFLPPCICNRTVFCTSGGDIETTETGIVFNDPFAVPPEEPGITLIRRTITEGENFNITTPYLNSTGLPDTSLEYFWYADPTVTDGPTLVTAGDGTQETFTMPVTLGSYFIYVYAFNGDDTSSAEIRIEIIPNRVKTIIIAEPSNEIIANTTVVLNATASIPINTNPNVPPLQIVGIQWTQLSGFSTPLSDSNAPDPSITPVLVGEVIFQLSLTDSNGYVDTEHVLIVVVDALVPASGAPNVPDTPCSLGGGVCTASEAYCEFVGGIQDALDCVTPGSSQSDLPGFGSTFCCLLVNGTVPGPPIPGTIPSGPPGNNRPVSPSPPPLSPVLPRARPLVPPSATQGGATLPGVGCIITTLLENLQRGRAFTAADYIFYAIIFGIQTIILLITTLYVCSPDIAAENELVYYAPLDDDDNGDD